MLQLAATNITSLVTLTFVNFNWANQLGAADVTNPSSQQAAANVTNRMPQLAAPNLTNLSPQLIAANVTNQMCNQKHLGASSVINKMAISQLATTNVLETANNKVNFCTLQKLHCHSFYFKLTCIYVLSRVYNNYGRLILYTSQFVIRM